MIGYAVGWSLVATAFVNVGAGFCVSEAASSAPRPDDGKNHLVARINYSAGFQPTDPEVTGNMSFPFAARSLQGFGTEGSPSHDEVSDRFPLRDDIAAADTAGRFPPVTRSRDVPA